MEQSILAWISQYGYFAIFFLLMLGIVGLPVPDETLGEHASCFIVLKSGASLTFDELKGFLAERKFAKFTWPEQLAIVPEMPMTPTRKVIKSELVRHYLKANGGA